MLKTAESVSPRHPDKLCDRISDAILDECLRQDPMSRVAMETMGGHGVVTVTGELTTRAKVDVEKIVRRIAGDKIQQISVNIVRQSPEIANGVDTGGAGDQGIMVGYACRDNEDYVPQELYLARNLNKLIFSEFSFDGKTQVTMNDGRIFSVVASFQNAKSAELRRIVDGWLNGKPVHGELTIFTNPAGDWNLGGFDADTGLTGRKIICDAYGPQIPVGGGAYSGKDGTKVDRSGAYMARKIAVDAAKKVGGEVLVKLAYAIGKKEPLMVTVTRPGSADSLPGINLNQYDLTPNGIINFLELRKPQFERTAEWGSYGNNFMWDK
ncbi:MAG: methionine adenosyltransferase domain-containing protein [Patescibacteria group bacterium]